MLKASHRKNQGRRAPQHPRAAQPNRWRSGQKSFPITMQLREEKLQVAVVRFRRRVVRGQCLHQRAIVELLYGTITEGHDASILSVTDAFTPLRRACTCVGRKE